MANTLQVKRSSVPSKVPATTDLALGELAINTYDGKLYLKKNNGTESVIEIGAGGGGGGSGTVTSVAVTVPTGLSVTGSPITSSGTIAISLASGYSIPTDTVQAEWSTAYTDRLKWDGGSAGLNASTGRTSLGLVIGTDVQAYDADLAAIAALSGTSGLLKKTAANTWELDTSTYLTSISSSDVTTALGYTPYNATNPNGYITGISSSDVTTALGYTPYNSTNPDGYVTSAALSGYLTTSAAASTYLPLSGGSLSGALTVGSGDLTVGSVAGGYRLILQNDSTYWSLEQSTSSLLIKNAGTTRGTIDSSGNWSIGGGVTITASGSANGVSATSGASGGYGGYFKNIDSGVNIEFFAASSNSGNRLFSGKNAGTEKIYGDVTGNLYTVHYTEGTYTANSGTALTLSLVNGTSQLITLTGSCTFTMPTATAGKSFVVQLNTGSGSFTATFTGVKWAGGTAPTITTTASRMDMFSFFADGTNWYGVAAGQSYTP